MWNKLLIYFENSESLVALNKSWTVFVIFFMARITESLLGSCDMVSVPLLLPDELKYCPDFDVGKSFSLDETTFDLILLHDLVLFAAI